MNKELRNKIKQAREEIIYKEKQKEQLLSKNIDYNFLQELIDKSNENQDLVITIYTHSGDKIVLQQKFKIPEQSFGYDGEPTEIEIR